MRFSFPNEAVPRLVLFRICNLKGLIEHRPVQLTYNSGVPSNRSRDAKSRRPQPERPLC
jgi:hypothetical protein